MFEDFQPEIVFHLAAQPLVRESYKEPRYTYETNVMGTANVLECVRQNYLTTKSVKSFLNVTTDKVYLNREWEWGYRENDPLDGYDPYSNSKSCSELVTHSYKKSFFTETDSPAMAAGIQSGDIITEAAGKKITSLSAYQSVLRDQKSGSKIRLKGQRQGSGGYVDISFDVTVGSKE